METTFYHMILCLSADCAIIQPMAKKTNYLSNKNLLQEVIASKEQSQMSDELAKMLMLLVAKYGKKGNWAGYTYNEDMQGYALMHLMNSWKSFNPEKSNNPFAFFTQCIKNSFIQFLNREKSQRNIRDALMVDAGLDPSWTYQEEHKAQSSE